MKILVIGAKGQVGTELVALGRLRGHEMVEAGQGTDTLQSVESKFAVEAVLNKAEKLDAVVNLAAYHSLKACEENPQKALDVNAFAQLHLASCLSKSPSVKLLFASTDYVFPGGPLPCEESSIPIPLSIYGFSKLLGERFTRSHGNHYIARMAHVFGHVKPKTKGPNLIFKLASSLKENGFAEVTDIGEISLVYAKDAARMLLEMLNCPPGIYHCVNRDSVSLENLASSIASMMEIEGADGPDAVRMKASTDELRTIRPVNARLVPSAVFELHNRSCFSAVREYLSELGYCTPFVKEKPAPIGGGVRV